MNRLSTFCNRVIDTATSAALILTPLYFNIFDTRIFEPDKIAFLRILALLTAFAWFIKWVDQFASGNVNLSSLLQLRKQPLILAACLLLVSGLISTLFALNPGISWGGSYQRSQGFLTLLSYLVFFASIAARVRSTDQSSRIIDLALTASLPIALFAIGQRLRLDPIPWGGDTVERVAAQLGNAIFLGAYFLMVIPLTITRFLQSLPGILENRRVKTLPFLHTLLLGILFLLQIAGLYLSGSRGPWLGVMVALFIFFVLFTLIRHYRKLLTGVILLGILAAAFLGVLNLSNGPLESIRNLPGISRLAHLFAAESETGQVRVLIWERAVQVVLPHEPIEFPDGSFDRWNAVRPFIGYGLENISMAFHPFYPAALGTLEDRNAIPDRSHNEIWDTLITTGGLGLAALLFLLGAVFYTGLKQLGLIPNRAALIRLIILLSAGAIIGAVGISIWRGPGFLGVGLPLGLLAGLAIYLILAAFYPVESALSTENALFAAAALAIAAGGLTEWSFGISIATTRLYFWVAAGLLLALPHMKHAPEPQSAPVTIRQRTHKIEQNSPSSMRTWLTTGISNGLWVSLLLLLIGYAFITAPSGATDGLAVLRHSLSLPIVSMVGTGATPQYAVLGLGLLTLLFTTFFLNSSIQKISRTDFWKSAAITSGLALILSAITWIIQSSNLYALTTTQPKTMDALVEVVNRYAGIVTGLFILLMIGIFAIAFIPVFSATQKKSAPALAAWIAAAILIPIFFWVSISGFLRPIQANIAFKLAEGFSSPQQQSVALRIYQRAIEINPGEDYYYDFITRTALTLTSGQEKAVRDSYYTLAENALITARDLTPLNTDHIANLARMYNQWAQANSDKTKVEQSIQMYTLVTRLFPENPRLWDEWASVYITTLQTPEQAIPILEKSWQLDPTYDWTAALMGQALYQMAITNTDPIQQEEQLSEAVSNFSMAISLEDTMLSSEKANMYLSQAGAYSLLKQYENAVRAYTQAAILARNDTNYWRIEMALAETYLAMGQKPDALLHAQTALKIAPENEKATIQSFINQNQP